jgi:antitoxin HigA-1
MAHAARRNPNRCPTHPGALLREDVIPATGLSLGKLFGDGARVWTRMQAAYDTWRAEQTEDVRAIPTIRAQVA